MVVMISKSIDILSAWTNWDGGMLLSLHAHSRYISKGREWTKLVVMKAFTGLLLSTMDE